MGAINAKAATRKHSFQEACLAMEISPTYLAEVFSPKARKTIDNLSNVYLKQIASYLEAPLAQVYILAGILSPTDFVVESSFVDEFQRMLAAMRADSHWSSVVPADEAFASAGNDIKLLIALLYERVTTQTLISKAQVDSDALPGPNA